MDKILQKWLWKPFSRIIGPLLLILLPGNLLNISQDETVMSGNTELLQILHPNSPPPIIILQEESEVGIEEISLRQFAEEFSTSSAEKIIQLIIENPKTAEQFQQGLIRSGDGTGKMAEPARALAELLRDLRPIVSLYRLLEEGVQAFDNADYSTALEKWQIGLEKAHELDNKDYISQFTGDIGKIYLKFEQYLKALDFFQQALKIHSDINDKHGEWTDLSNIGLAYIHLDQHAKALDFLQKALKISRSISDLRDGEGENLNQIGVVYNTLGQYQKALEYNTLSLAIKRKLNDKRGEGGSLANIGNVYQNLGQYSKALDFHQQALRIHRDLGDKPRMGKSLTSIGSIYRNLGQYQKALDFYQQALKIDRDLSGKHEEETLLTNIGNIYQEFGEYQEALELYQQALKIHRSIGNKYGEWVNSNNIGFAYQNLGKYQKAKEAFQDSAAILETVGSGYLWIAQRGLASTAAKINQFKAAMKHYEQAINNIETIRASLTKEHKTSFMRVRLYVYDELIALLQSLHLNQSEKGYDRKAIETFERKQGRIFLEEIGQSGARRFAGLSQEMVEAEQSLALRWQKLKAKPFTPEEYAALEQQEAELKQRIKAEYPKYYALKYPQPVDLATLQNQVLQPGEMMLVYNVIPEIPGLGLESKTILWVIGQHQFQMLTLDISEKTLQAKVNAFRAGPNMLIEAINTEPSWEIPDLAEDNLPSLRQASYDLYQRLLPAAAKTLLKDARTLYIVPTGPLYGLPFGALETHKPDEHDEPHYLIQDYPIAYLSSASLLKTIRDTERKETSHRYPLLAFAHPQYPNNCLSNSADAAQIIRALRTDTYLKLAASENAACFKELPETQEQAEAIAKLLKAPKRSHALQLRAKASRQNVFDFNKKKRLDDYQYVLFAAHAVLPNEITRINQSAIVLSNPDTEGYLTMADAFELDMNADLVMLSACNTGRGKKTRGEGVRGLTRAFMYAGTPAVSVSLWSVESRSTKALSISLFKYLQAGKPLAQALRQSKLDLMDHDYMEMYQHPYFWAPFVVFGDGGSTAD